MGKLRAYLLAAGQGRRAGGPKAWAAFGTTTLLEKQLSFLKGLFEPASLFVAIQEPWLERCRALDGAVRWVPADPQAAPLASLQSLVLASGAGVWGFAYHVDMPLWEPELFELLAGRIPQAETQGADAVLPFFEGRGGHPVLLSPRALALLAELDPRRDRLDLWLKSHPSLRVEVPFACVRENWNLGAPAGR